MLLVFFSYPKTSPAYHEICKYLMNCPLAEAFTKTPSMVYQNLLREFWCTVVATHPNPPTDDFEVHPLKEYTIKFSVMNSKKPLTLDFNTFIESTGLNYAKDAYVSHPSPKVVKDELAKTIDNLILLNRTPNLKTAFPMAWGILLTFVIQVLGGNYSSTEQVDSIQQLFVYCLLTGTKGPEASEALPQKRKKPKFKKTPNETKVTQPKPTEGYEKSHSVSSGTIHDPQDPERNIQLVGTGLPSTLDEGTRKSQPLLEVSDEGAAKTTPLTKEPSFLLFEDELVQESDEEVFATREDMDEDTQANEEV
ncbi:hypothetical protein Tco_0155973 [Tanacetum coccineum]